MTRQKYNFTHFLRLLSSGVVSAIFLLCITFQVNAQDPSYVHDYPNSMEAAETNNELNAPGHFSMGQETLISHLITGLDGAIEGVTVPVNAYKNHPEYVKRLNTQSAIGGLSTIAMALYTQPPADLALWILDTGHTLGFVPKQVYAQDRGIGFNGLAPLLNIWKSFRNVSYGLLAIVLVVIGFMVMLRKKIDPKTVVTVQNALPRIIVTLLLITFSYAIVGLVIDIMYFLIYLAVFLVGQGAGLSPQSISTLQNNTTTGNIFTLTGNIFVNGFAGFLALGGGGVAGVLTAIFGGIGAVIPLIVAAVFGLPALAGAPIVLLGAGIGILVLILLVSIVLFIAVFRIFFMLLMSYINILLALVFGPIQIMLGALPGNEAFSSWFKNLIANMLVFPATALLLTLTQAFIQLGTTQNVWSAPFVGGGQGLISGILALGMLLIIPTIGNAIKEMLKAEGYKYANAPGQVIGAVFGAPTAFAGGLVQTAITQAIYSQALARQPKKGGGDGSHG